MFDDVPGGKTDHQGENDGEQPVGGEVHEPEVYHATEALRLPGIGCAGDVEVVGKQTLQDQRDTERQQQAIDVVKVIETLEHEAFNGHPQNTDDYGRHQQ